MVEHSFNIEIAQGYGVPAAILYRHFQYWITKNLTNQKNFHDGRTWTYNTIRALADQFPYLTVWDVRQALKKLIEGGVLLSGNYNKRQNDRTLWYCFADEKAALKGLPSHLWKTHKDCEPHTAICVSHTANCESHTTLPNPIPNKEPDKKTNTTLKKSSEKMLALDLRLGEEKKFFLQQLQHIFKPNKRSAVTLASVTRFLIDECQAGRLKVSIFTDLIKEARKVSVIRTIKIPTAFFVSIVKKKTGFKGQEKLLN